ncbi:MAG: hypothetical protein HY855_23705 [Burkholderiales bacterium]|nr:hypothetical protein [Burkholderiales bacterium]
MATPSTLNAVIARVAAGLFDYQLGNATMGWAVQSVNSVTHNGSVGAFTQSLYAAQGLTHSTAAAALAKNLGLTGAVATDVTAYIKGLLDAAPAGKEGDTIVAILNGVATITTHPVAEIAAAAAAFNLQITKALTYSASINTPDVPVHPPVVQTNFFTLVAETAAGADVMHLTGNQDVRIDFTNPANQIVGLDVDGDGTIEFNGVERNITGMAADFEIVDAYPRNPLNHTDIANNFTGDIYFDGTGFKGDGVNTNGNIFLGGLGVDEAFGGIGNDFLAGGGIAQGRTGSDVLRGGRNADFFFAEFSGLDAKDGTSLLVDGGNTSDDTAAGNGQSAQDSDWLLFEASDDDEPVQVWLNDDNGGPAEPGDGITDNMGRVLSRAGESMLLDDVENFDASGNLYGFLNDVAVEIGGRAIDDRDADTATVGYNYGIGSSAQVRVFGSEVANKIIGGYDNDRLEGAGGADLLMGGNLAFLNNPNLVGIVNNGRDELIGGAGGDNIVFEADGGIIDGGADTDTLWLTNLALGTQTATDLTTDGYLRLDLRSQNIDEANGYGGANVGSFNFVADDTQDQTNYKSSATRVTVQNMENVIATGLGGVDYVAAGTNNPELLFNNVQNQGRYTGNLDLRGTQTANTLYASNGIDVLEGRAGNDRLSGGDGNDDFYFGTSDAGSDIGDGVDVIHRQSDANGDNLWDGFNHITGTGGNFERDFNIGGTSSTGASVLKVAVQKAGGNTAGTQLNQVVNFVSEIVTGVKVGATFTAITLNTAAIKAATTYQGLTDAINAALDATAFGADLQATLQADGFTIHIADAQGRELADSSSEVPGAGVSVNQIANTATQNTFEYGAPAVAVTKDRLIYKSYEDRLDNEGVDDDSVLGSIISLGIDSYAEDHVINFADEDADGLATTRIAEDQLYNIDFLNLTTQDKVTIDINGVKYTLQVGVDLDGNTIAAEDGVGDDQVSIQNAFLTRLVSFIDTYMDDDTSAGQVNATIRTNATAIDRNNDGDTLDAFEAIGSYNVGLSVNQVAYNGEETVFMTLPTVDTSGQASGGERWSVTVTNVSEHELELLDFDGRNGELNETNVLFWGQEAVNRAELSTAKNAGDTLTGYEAMVIDVGPNNLQDVVFGTTTAIPNNTATNFPLSTIANGWSVHGDDFLLGGNGLDTINGGTGDDRVEGSIGGNGTTTWDTLDGGKNFYAVQVLGEAQARVYILNKWEAANPTKVTALQGLVISSLTLIDQNETGTGVSSGVFDDTLQFSQKLFTAGTTRFTVTLDNFALTGGVVELRNDGAGTVGVDVDGNGTIDNWTRFTNFENIRTVSGVGAATAATPGVADSGGQGNDTLNVTGLSSATTGANGILYNLSVDTVSGIAPGSVMYSANAHASLTKPAIADFESLVIKVDGVESVIAGTGDDLLIIDESEAAKNNVFTGDLGDDRIIYQNEFDGEATPGVAEPTVTIKVDTVAAAVGGTDTVTMTGGRVGQTVATDTLNGVEFVSLEERTAAGTREDDVLDVTAMTSGAIVSYVDGTVRALDNTLHLTIDGIDEIENIWADGNDTVLVASSATMNGNQRSDAGTAAGTNDVDVQLGTFVDFDTLKTPGTDNTRKTFLTQTTAEIEDVINQNQFKFNLSKTGSGADSDTVDYSNATDNISVVVELDATKPNQYVLVDSDGATFYDAVGDLEEAGDRVDQLISVERIVAARGESVLDLTSSTKGLEIKWSAFDVANQTASLDRDTYSVRISDLTTASPLQRTFVEYRDAGLSATVTQNKATWSRLEGSDNAEVLILNSAHSTDTNAFNLRGGANQVKYNELTKSITLTLSVTDFSAASALTTGKVTGTVVFQDGQGAGVESGTFLGGTHTITSYTANNGIASGSLRVAASQDAEDTLKFSGLTEKLFLVAETGTVDNQITVKLGTGAAQNSVVLTGFELVSDSASNDVYDFGSLLNAGAGLNFIDDNTDHDTVKVGNDAIDFDGTNAMGAGAVLAGAAEISLGAIRDNGTLATAGFDFDVLDVTKVTNTTVTTVTGANTGTGDVNTDEVVFGAINNINSALLFESVVFTQATVTENGTTYVLNTTANSVTAGAKTITLTNGANTLSFGGTVLQQAASPNHLRAATDLNATSGVTVTIVGNEAVNITGGNGNDTITTNGGDDTLRGGSGNDTLNGGFTAAVGEIATVTLGGGAAVLSGAEVLTLTGNVGTLTITGSGGAGELKTASATADADQIGALLIAQTNAFLETELGYAAGTILSKTYDASSNVFTLNFTAAAGDVANLASAVSAGTMTAVAGNTAGAAAVQSLDTYVFESTATLNGADTINNFNAANAATDDLLDFTAFLGAAATTGGAAVNGGTGDLDLTANLVGVMFNKGSVTASDVKLVGAATATNGEVFIADNSKRVVLVTADDNGTSDATINAYLVYYVEDTNATVGAQTFAVTLVGTINSATELNAADLFTGTDSFV